MPGALEAQRGGSWSRGEATYSVRWPAKAFDLPDANMVSLVLRVDWRDRQLWLMGDALGIQERDLLNLGDPGPGIHRILKAGHHGSRSSSDPDWIHTLAPEQVLITAGRRNRFGHPHTETLETLRGIPTHHVGEARGILLQATPRGWRMTSGLSPSGD